jgi:type II secretory ATPase GspE/PulE/Tfp pilus assembly ATPase PilB-like protein
VFSTLHTNDSAGSFTRLLDMGVEPFLVASAVAGVVAQRLVRRLCPDCRKVHVPDRARLEGLDFPMDKLATGVIYEPSTCEACRMTGFRGRGGIFEVLLVTEEIESLVVAHSSAHDIKMKAIEQGMVTLRDDGWQKVLNGFTTIEEVLRVTEENQ